MTLQAESGRSHPRIALLGYGAIADVHARVLCRLGADIRIVAGPDEDGARSFAAEHGIPRASTDLKEAIGQDIDAVVIASPNAVHAEQALSALAAGRHVFVEVPLALSVEEAQTVVAASGDRVLAVGHTTRYAEPYRAAIRALAGRPQPLSVFARRLVLRRTNVGWTGRQRSWIDDVLWHHGAHVVDSAVGLLGSAITDVAAFAGAPGSNGKPLDYGIVLRSADGGIASVALSFNATIPAYDYLVTGSGEAIALSETTARSGHETLYRGTSRGDVLTSAVTRQHRDFLDAIRGGPRPVSDGASVLETYRLLATVEEQTRARL